MFKGERQEDIDLGSNGRGHCYRAKGTCGMQGGGEAIPKYPLKRSMTVTTQTSMAMHMNHSHNMITSPMLEAG